MRYPTISVDTTVRKHKGIFTEVQMPKSLLNTSLEHAKGLKIYVTFK